MNTLSNNLSQASRTRDSGEYEKDTAEDRKGPVRIPLIQQQRVNQTRLRLPSKANFPLGGT